MARTFNRTKFLEQESRKLLKILPKRFVDYYRSSILNIYIQIKDTEDKKSVEEITKHLNKSTKIKSIDEFEDFILKLVNLTFELLASYKTTKIEFIYEIVSNFVQCFHLLIIQVSLINFSREGIDKEVSRNMLRPLLDLSKLFSYEIAIKTSKLLKKRTARNILHASKRNETVLKDLDKLYKSKNHYQLNNGEKILYEIGKYQHLNFMMLIEISGPIHDSPAITDNLGKMIEAIESSFLIQDGDFIGSFFNADGFYAPETKTEISFFRIEKILMEIIKCRKSVSIKSYAKYLLANRHRLYRRKISEDEKKSPRFAKAIQKRFSYTTEEKEILRDCKDFMILGSNAYKKNSQGLKIVEKPKRAVSSLAKEVQKYLSRGK